MALQKSKDLDIKFCAYDTFSRIPKSDSKDKKKRNHLYMSCANDYLNNLPLLNLKLSHMSPLDLPYNTPLSAVRYTEDNFYNVMGTKVRICGGKMIIKDEEIKGEEKEFIRIQIDHYRSLFDLPPLALKED